MIPTTSTEGYYKQLIDISVLYASKFEIDFDPTITVNFTANSWFVPITCVIIYGLFLLIGTKMMKTMDPFDLKWPLALWNLFLCIFSAIGVWRTAPFLIASLLGKGFEHTICTHPNNYWGFGPAGFWVMLLNFSKILELIDTVFIVLRKKSLLFLHWYHHITVLLFCWNAYSTTAGSGLYFVSMNYFVHSLMYGYYFTQAVGIPSPIPPVLITVVQIVQMIVGTFVCCSGWYYRLSGVSCANDLSNLVSGAVMYASYLFLFMEFALKRYVKKRL
eukprot:gene4153-5917_t